MMIEQSRPRRWPSPRLEALTLPSDLPVTTLLLGVLGATFVYGAMFYHPTYPNLSLLVGFSLASFILVVHKPTWVLVPVLITEMTLYNYVNPKFGMGHRMVIILLAVVLARIVIIKGLRYDGPALGRVLMPSIALIGMATYINAMFSPMGYVSQYFRYQVTQVLVLVLVASVITNRSDMSKVAKVALGLGLAGALAAIWQHFAEGSAPYGYATDVYRGRALGLTSGPVGFATQMIFVLGPVLGVLLCAQWKRDRRFLFLLASTVILVLGLNFSYTRSAVFAIGPGLVVMGLLLQGMKRWVVLSVVVLAVATFQLLAGTGILGPRYYQGAEEDPSAASRTFLGKVGLAIALDNIAVGIGNQNFEAVAVDYIDVIFNDSNLGDGLSEAELMGIQAVGRERPHNDFLSVWMSWGILALAAYLGIFYGTLRNCVVASRHHDRLIRGLAIGCAGGVTMYAVNSTVHNSMDSSVFLWAYAGFSVALVRVAKRTTRVSPLPTSVRFSSN